MEHKDKQTTIYVFRFTAQVSRNGNVSRSEVRPAANADPFPFHSQLEKRTHSTSLRRRQMRLRQKHGKRIEKEVKQFLGWRWNLTHT